MLSNVILFVLFVLVIVAYMVANIIMAVIAIKDNSTISDILSEQDFGLGKVGVSLMYWPAFLALYIKSLLPINTKSCFDEEENLYNLKNYTLSELLELSPEQWVVITPKNYFNILKFAEIANKNKDVEIDIKNNTVTDKYLDSNAFYGVKMHVFYKDTSTCVTKYMITCYNAIRPEILEMVQ